MTTRINKLGEIESRRRSGPRDRAGLENWLNAYRDSVGPAGDLCVSLLQDLYGLGALQGGVTGQAIELLETLEALSPDPITISSALVHVAGLDGTDLSAITDELPAEVKRQLDDLEKLKHYESGQSLSGTERSAEGLRRLLLALVKDVRVVLIDLAWQLVLLRGVKQSDDDASNLARETILGWSRLSREKCAQGAVPWRPT